MGTLLVALDGSDSALRALEFAARQALALGGARLHVLAVVPPVNVYGEVEVYAGEERMRELAAGEVRGILDAAGEALRGASVEFELEQLDGQPAEVIARRATEIGCDWIVMGTHGHGRLGAAVLGSVAQSVVHLATVPVMLVK
ncbi:MAG: universal stress protein [Gammaproteobacteria bacterium]|nr:universal stress protein [Gammaproteobacteria bacterium]